MAKDPRREDVHAFQNDDDGRPFVMLNLLRFAEGGRARYREYMRAVAPILARIGGEVVYGGDGLAALVAESGQAWDAVLLVRYPNRAAFLRLVKDPDYQKVTHLRTESLVESVLQPTAPWAASTG